MVHKPDRRRLRHLVERQARRLEDAERDRPTLLAQTTYVGMLGLLFVIPVIVGAYLGRWLDGLYEGYAVRWTVSLILIGVFVGAMNVYLYIRE